MELMLCALGLLALVLTPSPAAAEEAQSFIQISGGSAARLPLALPEFKAGTGPDRQLIEDLGEIVGRDLRLCGYFVLLDPMAFLEDATAGILLGEFDFANWRAPGAVGLVKGRVSVVDGQLAVDLHVYDVDAGVEILARRIEGPREGQRQIAHRVANTIIEAFTGEPGVFDTQIVAVANLGHGKEIYILDADGWNPWSVSRNGSINLSPAWSPDGHQIAYTSYRDNNPDLWVTDLRTGRHRKVSAHPGINAGAEWAPDGGELALTLSKDGDSEIYSIGEDGRIVQRLTRQYGIDVSPSFSPDGQTIAFVSSRNGAPQIFLMARDGSQVRRLTHLGGHNVSPAFSPDGRRVAFAGRDEGRFDIFVIGVDGRGLKRLTQNTGDDEDPSWSPDGNHILFASSRGGESKQLYLMTADGETQTRLTDGRGSYTNPSWGPQSP